MVHYQARLPSLGRRPAGQPYHSGNWAVLRTGQAWGLVHLESRHDVSVGALMTASRPTEACVPAAWQDWQNE